VPRGQTDGAGTQFTCFTGTKAQVLTQSACCLPPKKKKAAVRIAVEMFKQGAMTKDDAICKVSECLF
jgi:hypothetical protein